MSSQPHPCTKQAVAHLLVLSFFPHLFHPTIMKIVQSCLSSRWEPLSNLGKRLEYLPPPNGKHTTFFHHWYGGFHSNNTPVLFTPSEALMWGITRFKRDGLANLSGPRNYPIFLHYIFEVSVRSGEAVSTNMPANGNPSKEELLFFFRISILLSSRRHRIAILQIHILQPQQAITLM